MSKLVSSLVICLVALGSMLPAQGSPDGNFEGIVTYEWKGDDGQGKAKKNTLTFKVKNNKARIEVEEEGSDVSEGGATILIDMASKEYVTMIEKDTQKMAMVFSLDEFKEMMANIQDGEEEGDGTNVALTDETKEINGYECRKVVMANDKLKNEAWITQAIDIDFTKLFPVFESTDKWGRYTDAYKGFVMKVHSKDLESSEEYSCVASVNEKPLNDDLFNVPSSYQKMDMGQMMEEFKEANPEVYEKMLQQLQH